MTKLVDLDLTRTQVTDAGLAHLKGLVNLATLDLDGTKLTDAGLAHLKGLTALETLPLDDTAITDAGLAEPERPAKSETVVPQQNQDHRRGTGALEEARRT